MKGHLNLVDQRFVHLVSACDSVGRMNVDSGRMNPFCCFNGIHVTDFNFIKHEKATLLDAPIIAVVARESTSKRVIDESLARFR